MATPQICEPSAPRRVKKDTGFPEPFNGDRNTTLPHPDADTSQNATIEAPDDLTRAPSRGSSFHLFSHSRRKDSNESSFTESSYDNNDSSDHISINSSRRDSSPSEAKSKKGFLSVMAGRM